VSARALVLVCAAAAFLGAAVSGAGAQQQRCVSGFTCDDPEWRFTYASRRVKVVLFAGSIGRQLRPPASPVPSPEPKV
jgi:hypothetical protein